MALIRDVVYKRGPSVLDLILRERDKLNLKAVQRILVQFDPFRDDTVEIRKFASLLYARETVASNPKCILRTEVLTDRSEQRVTFELIDGKRFIFKCANLKSLDIFKLMNVHLTPLAPEEIEVTTRVPKLTKKKKK